MPIVVDPEDQINEANHQTTGFTFSFASEADRITSYDIDSPMCLRVTYSDRMKELYAEEPEQVVSDYYYLCWIGSVDNKPWAFFQAIATKDLIVIGPNGEVLSMDEFYSVAYNVSPIDAGGQQ